MLQKAPPPGLIALAVLLIVATIGAAVWFYKPASEPVASESVVDAALRSAEREMTARRRSRPPMERAANSADPAPSSSTPDNDKEKDKKADDSLPSLEDIVTRASPAVVQVETPSGRGTAFFVKPGTLLTNVHVVRGASVVTIRRQNGSTAVARVERQAADYDVAVLEVDPVPNQPTIPLGSALNARAGGEVLAIGSPLGMLQNTVTRGIVSAIRQSGNATLIQTDAAVNPGNSGGPLLDRKGNAIGITTMGFTERQGLSFAVAIDHAQNVLAGRVAPERLQVSTSGGDLALLSPVQTSDHDEARAVGQKRLESGLAQLAREADALDDYWQRFRKSCYSGSVTGDLDREWMAVLNPRNLKGSVAPGCEGSFSYLQEQAGAIRSGVLASDEQARRADVLPGVRRDLRQKYRFANGLE